jgi:formate dehydrogenase maturation protein FdhE
LSPPAPGGASVEARFGARADRAEALAERAPAGREALLFAAGLFRVQGVVAGAIDRAHQAHRLGGGLKDDLPRIAAEMSALVGFAAERGPPALQDDARQLAELGPRLAAVWDGSVEGDYLARALLRPYLEVLAAAGVRPERARPEGGCPFCGGAASIACRRSPPGAIDGAQRLLGCGLCGGEWPVNRIRCPACGEESPDRLPIFHTDRHPAARIEACARCQTYVKSIDLTGDGRAIPEVDDLCSLSLDLWAAEQGYRRLEAGLAGI